MKKATLDEEMKGIERLIELCDHSQSERDQQTLQTYTRRPFNKIQNDTKQRNQMLAQHMPLWA